MAGPHGGLVRACGIFWKLRSPRFAAHPGFCFCSFLPPPNLAAQLEPEEPVSMSAVLCSADTGTGEAGREQETVRKAGVKPLSAVRGGGSGGRVGPLGVNSGT